MNIVVIDGFEKHGIDILQKKRLAHTVVRGVELEKHLSTVEALLIPHTFHVPRSLLEQAPHLRYIVTASVGKDHIDETYCKEKNITIFNAPGSNTIPVAEHVVALVFALMRKLHTADRLIRSGKWELDELPADELEGKVVGCAGFGAIGQLAAKKLAALGARIIAYDPVVRADDFGVASVPRIEDLVSQSDIVTIHMPLLPQTRHLFDARLLSLMKHGAMLINTSRGGVIDENALIDALTQKKIVAGLDVFEDEPRINPRFMTLQNVILTPHIAYASNPGKKRMAEISLSAFFTAIGK